VARVDNDLQDVCGIGEIGVKEGQYRGHAWHRGARHRGHSGLEAKQDQGSTQRES
jgi:hypothetical protein